METLGATSPDDRKMVLGIANQRETTVLWDRETGEPLHIMLFDLLTQNKSS